MSDSIATRIKTVALARGGASDLRMLAEVERWMAMIREIKREQRANIPAVN